MYRAPFFYNAFIIWFNLCMTKYKTKANVLSIMNNFHFVRYNENKYNDYNTDIQLLCMKMRYIANTILYWE